MHVQENSLLPPTEHRPPAYGLRLYAAWSVADNFSVGTIPGIVALRQIYISHRSLPRRIQSCAHGSDWRIHVVDTVSQFLIFSDTQSTSSHNFREPLLCGPFRLFHGKPVSTLVSRLEHHQLSDRKFPVHEPRLHT